MAQPFEIVRSDGSTVASNGTARMQLLADCGAMFRRRAVKGVGTEQAQTIEWAVAELDGVRAYFNGTDVIVTRKDLQP